MIEALMAIRCGRREWAETVVGDRLEPVYSRRLLLDGIQVGQQIVNERRTQPRAPRHRRNRTPLWPSADDEWVGQAIVDQPAGSGGPAMGRSIGENDDGGAVGQRGQSLGRAGRDFHQLRVALKKSVEQLPAILDVEVGGFARSVDILEQGEAVDPHFQSVSPDELFEPANEQAQDLVHIHHDQWPIWIDTEAKDFRWEWYGVHGLLPWANVGLRILRSVASWKLFRANRMAKTVLIVEDNELNMKLFRDLIESLGYDTLRTGEGLAAFKLAREHRPDLILMDIQLPAMSGLEVTRWLKEDADLAAIPVVAITAFAMRGDEERIRDGGCVAYIAKPISVSGFLDTMRRFLA